MLATHYYFVANLFIRQLVTTGVNFYSSNKLRVSSTVCSWHCLKVNHGDSHITVVQQLLNNGNIIIGMEQMTGLLIQCPRHKGTVIVTVQILLMQINHLSQMLLQLRLNKLGQRYSSIFLTLALELQIVLAALVQVGLMLSPVLAKCVSDLLVAAQFYPLFYWLLCLVDWTHHYRDDMEDRVLEGDQLDQNIKVILNAWNRNIIS